MKKVVQVKVQLEKQPDGITRYKYPIGYDSSKIQILAYSGEEPQNVLHCIGIVEDRDLDKFLQVSDIVEITLERADALGKVWRPAKMKITDEKYVASISEKIKAGIPLTGTEIKALDPKDNSVLGLNYSEMFDIRSFTN